MYIVVIRESGKLSGIVSKLAESKWVPDVFMTEEDAQAAIDRWYEKHPGQEGKLKIVKCALRDGSEVENA